MYCSSNFAKLTLQYGERVCIKFIALSFELFQTSCKNPLAAAIASICDQTMAFCSQSVLCAVLCDCFKEFWQNTLKVVLSSGDGSSILFFYVGVSYITFPVSVSFWLCHSPCYVRWSIFTQSPRWLDNVAQTDGFFLDVPGCVWLNKIWSREGFYLL